MVTTEAARSNDAPRLDGDSVAREIGLVTRVLRVGSGLVKVHLEFAKREADKDKQRVFGALATAAVGAILLALGLVLVDVFVVVLIHAEAKLALHWSILAVCGGNLALGGLLVFAAARRLKAPVMPETRDLVQKTLTAMTDG